MDQRRMVNISKFLSKYLRHSPEELGLTLQEGGWVPVDALLAGAANKGMHFSRAELDEVVEKNDKKRFSFDDSGTRIRANQGHSTPVDLQLEPKTPPDVLYHGTASSTLPVILKDGLQRMSRHHVHLSVTTPTARNVGSRHGSPVVLRIDARAMHEAGITFYCSDNGVWLVDSVPPEYLRVQ